MLKIAVLTSGGDAPGMNAALRACVRTGIRYGCQMHVIENGFRGLIEGLIIPVTRDTVKDIISRGGTIIKTSRSEAFKEVEVQKAAIQRLRDLEIDGLIVIGGDGTYRGVRELCRLGYPCIGIPATIDNDIASTDFTIGFDTCLNTICECVDKLRDTSTSHQRCSIIEVMGRKCGDLAVFAGVAEGVEMVLSFDHQLTNEQINKRLSDLKEGGKSHAIVLVSENLLDIKELAKVIQDGTGFECKTEVLGRLQRGGKPSAVDRILASRFGNMAVKLLLANRTSECVGIRNNQIVSYTFDEALDMERESKHEYITLLDVLK